MSYIGTAPAAKKQLVTILSAALVTPASLLEVHRNRTKENHQIEENVYVTDILKGSRHWVTMRGPLPARIEETYHILVEIEVLRRGNEPDSTEDRCWEILGVIEDTLMVNYTLGGLNGIVEAKIVGFEQTSEGGNDGWDCSALLEIFVKARI